MLVFFLKKKIIVWGAGQDGQKTVELLDEMALKICGIFDKNKQGQKINGHLVLDISAIKELIDNIHTIIIISSVKYADEMLKDIIDFGIQTYGVYTYGGLKIAVELNIMSEKINNSFRRSFLQMRKIYLKSVWEGSVEESVTRQWMTNLLLNHEVGILVFQSGKVGSSTLYHSLDLMGVPAVQIHFFQNNRDLRSIFRSNRKN